VKTLHVLLFCFAITHAFPTVAVPVHLGDLNEDAEVTVLDLVRLINHLNGTTSLPSPLPFFADVNQDTFLNQSDVDAMVEIILGAQPVVAFPLDIVMETSPVHGEANVAVTRETVLRFSQPLSTNTVFTTNHLFATFAGRRILSRIELATDRKTVTLFYQEPLPGSARVRVTFNGNGIQDFIGRPLDPDGNGVAGGEKLVDFDTSSTTPVEGTAIIGHVFASHQVLSKGNNTTNFVNQPLANVQITVDGMEQTMRTFTDNNGFFRLQPCPAGRFFVHIDGRTVTNVSAGIRYPDLAYYPAVGKAWEAVPGRTNNLAAGTGQIYLPLVAAGTLQPVSLTEDTQINFPPEVGAQNPAWAGVSIIVPANALYSDTGGRGGKVGLAPVPSDRLPEPLPAGIVHALDISIQTDGAQNVDRPLPARFPNVPDPKTGVRLSAGAKSALMSYNHDLGRWEIQGPMTVTADGNYVETDPGVGVRQPGWHGTMQGSQGSGGPITGPGPGSGPYDDDIDDDGIPNGQDDDVDGDGVGNGNDPDIDGDGIPNNQDSDMDGDGVPNNQDDDQDGDGIPNDQDPDPDGPEPQCSVSITGTTQGTVGDTLTLSSSVSPAGGTYGWAIVGSGASFSSGQNGSSAQLNLLAQGTVTVHLTYRPPGVNSADGQCSSDVTITIAPQPTTVEIIYPSDGDSFTTSIGSRFDNLTFVARLNPQPQPGSPTVVVTWDFIDLAYAPVGTVATRQGERVTPSIPVRSPPPSGPGLNDNGRGIALSFQARASITVNGQTVSDTITLTQDATDQIRQQYVDLGRQRPAKSLFVGGVTIPTIAILNTRLGQANSTYIAEATSRLTQRRDQINAIQQQRPLTPNEQQELATINANLTSVQTYAFNINSSYRTPYHNRHEDGEVNSLHIYGRAVDISPVPPHLDVLDPANPRQIASGIIAGALAGPGFDVVQYPNRTGNSRYNEVHVEYYVGGVNGTHDGTCDLNGAAPNPPSP